MTVSSDCSCSSKGLTPAPPKAAPCSACWRSWRSCNANSSSPTPATAWHPPAPVAGSAAAVRNSPPRRSLPHSVYDEGGHTVQQIADILNVKRGTLYGHLDKASVGTRPRAAARTTPTPPRAPSAATAAAAVHQPHPIPATEQHRRSAPGRQRVAIRASTCPTCGNEPTDTGDRWRQRRDLAVTWLYPHPTDPQRQPVEQVHCAACQPHQQVATVVCELCGTDRCWSTT